MRPEDYFANRAQVAVRQQIVEAVSDGLKAPDTFLRALALYRGEDRTVEFLTLPKSLVEPVEAPADDVLAKWFEEHKANYAAPEYRKISYVKLEPADIADEGAITDEAVKADYEKQQGALHDARDAHHRAAGLSRPRKPPTRPPPRSRPARPSTSW